MKSSTKPLLGWLGVVALLGLGSYFSWKALRDAKPAGPADRPAGGRPPSTVIVHAAEQREIAETLSVTGTLRAVRRADIAALEAAAIQAVHVNEGDDVKKGDPIVTLDGRRLSAQQQEAEADLTSAEALRTQRAAELERARRDLEMMDALWAERAVSEREFLDSKRGLQVATAMQEAAVEAAAAARKRLDVFEVRSADLQVKAPFDGKIVQRHAELGEWVNEGDSVATLVSTGEIEAWLQVPERHAMRMKDTAPGEIVLKIPGRKEPARADRIRIVPDIEGRSRLFTVIAHIPDVGTHFTPGSSVDAIVPLGAEVPRTVIPADAVLKGFSGTYVYVPSGSPQTAKRVNVTVLFERGGESILGDGEIEAGQPVIVEGNERLMPGAPVNPQSRKLPISADSSAPDDSLPQ
jgi:RND family efflux transporter MFP subunit